MGIDVYLSWDGQTEQEKKAQLTGFSVVHGHVGYLREAYHGGPYVTKFLCVEAYEAVSRQDYSDWKEGVAIPAAVLRARLPKALKLAQRRQREIYEYNSATADEEDRALNLAILKSFKDFVTLVERLEAEGKHPRVRFSG